MNPVDSVCWNYRYSKGSAIDVSVNCFVDGSVNLSATGVGYWSIGNSPGTLTIVDMNDPNTVIKDFSAKGSYELIWNNGICTWYC